MAAEATAASACDAAAADERALRRKYKGLNLPNGEKRNSFQSSPETHCRTNQLAPNHGPTAVDLSPIHSPQMSPRTPFRETQVWFRLCATRFFDIVIAIAISIAPNFDNDRFHSSIFCQRV